MPRKPKNTESKHDNSDDYVNNLIQQMHNPEKNTTDSFLHQLGQGSNGNDTGMLNKFRKHYISDSGNSSALKIKVPKTSSSTDTSLQKDADELFEADISDIKKPSKSKIFSFSKTPKNFKKAKPKTTKAREPNRINREDLKVSLSSDFEGGLDEDVEASPDNLTLKTNSTEKLADSSKKRIRRPPKEDYFASEEEIQEVPMDDNYRGVDKEGIKNKVVKKSNKQITTATKTNAKKNTNTNTNKKKTNANTNTKKKITNTNTNTNINKNKKKKVAVVVEAQEEDIENQNKIMKDIISVARANNKRVKIPASFFDNDTYTYTSPNYTYKLVNGEMQPFLDESNPMNILQVPTKVNKPKRKPRTPEASSTTGATNTNTKSQAQVIKPKKHAPFSFYGWYADVESGSEKKTRLAVDDSPKEINYENMAKGINAGVSFDLSNLRVVNMKIKPNSKTNVEKAMGAEIYNVLPGYGEVKLRVCIANNKFFVRESVTFVVPEGNEYTIENVGKVEAHLFVILDKKGFRSN